MARRSRLARTTIVHALAWPLLGLLAIASSAVLHVVSDGGRRALAAQLSRTSSELVRGEVTVGAIDYVSFHALALRDVVVTDAQGDRVASGATVRVDIDEGALGTDVVHFREIVLVDAWASLHLHDGEPALVQALTPTQPRSERARERVGVVIDRLVSDGGTLIDLPGDRTARDLGLELSFATEPHLVLDVTRATGALLEAGEEIARIGRTGAHIDASGETLSTVALAVRVGEDDFSLEATARLREAALASFSIAAGGTLSPALLELAGRDDLALLLTSNVRAAVHAEGGQDGFSGDAVLSTDGGDVTLHATRGRDRLTISMVARELAVGAFTSMTDGVLSAEVELAIAPLEVSSGEARVLSLDIADARWNDFVLGPASLRASVDQSRVTIESVAVPHLIEGGGHLDLTGQVELAGGARFTLDARLPELAADENVRRAAPDAHAALEARLTAEIGSGDDRTVEISGRVALEGARRESARVERAELTGEIHGTQSALTVDVRGTAHHLGLGGVTMRDVALRVTGGPERYEATGNVALSSGERIALVGDLTRRDARFEGKLSMTALRAWPSRVLGELSGIVITPGDDVRIGAFSVLGDGLELRGHGGYRFDGDITLEAELRRLDLAKVAQRYGLGGLGAGSATASIQMQGTLDRPEASVVLALDHAAIGPFDVPRLRFSGEASSRRGKVESDIELVTTGYGRAEAHLTSDLGRGASFEDRLRDGDFDVAFDATEVPAALASLASPTLPPFDGVVALSGTFRGKVTAPVIHVRAGVRGFAVPSLREVDAEVRVSIDGRDLDATVELSDRHGPLGQAHARAGVMLGRLFERTRQRRSRRSLLEGSWDLTGELVERRADRLPIRTRDPLPDVLLVSGNASAHGGAGPVEVDAQVRLDATKSAADIDSRCARGAPPRLALEATLRGERAIVRGRGEVASRRVLDLTVETTVRDMALGPIDITADLHDLRIADVPFACGRVRGAVVGHLDARGLLGARPRGTLDLHTETLSGRALDHARLGLMARMTSSELSANVTFGNGSATPMRASWRAPLTFAAGAGSPSLAGPWRASIALDHAAVAPLVLALPDIATATGELNGYLSIEGPSEAPRVLGTIDLAGLGVTTNDGSLAVAGARGRLVARGTEIGLEGVVVPIGGGTVALNGHVGLQGVVPSTVALSVEARNVGFGADPSRRGRINARARATGHLSNDERALAFVFDRTYVTLPPAPPASGDAATRDRSGARSEATSRAGAAAVTLSFRTEHPVVVRRNDLDVQLAMDVTVDADARGARSSGTLSIVGGTLHTPRGQVLLEPSTLTLDGRDAPDPILDISMLATSGGDRGTRMRMRGRLSAPEMTIARVIDGREGDPLPIAEQGARAEDMERRRAEMVLGLGVLEEGLSRALSDVLSRLRPAGRD